MTEFLFSQLIFKYLELFFFVVKEIMSICKQPHFINDIVKKTNFLDYIYCQNLKVDVV